MTRPVVARSLSLSVACMNIPTKVGPAKWRTCFNKLAAAGDVISINEAGSLKAKRLYNRLKNQHHMSQFGLFRGPNPIFWDVRKFAKVSAKQIRLHARGTGALARRFPGFNGARFMTVVVLQPLDAEGHRLGPEVAFLNWHFVAPGPKVPAAWRARKRRQSEAKVRAERAKHIAAGRIVVGNGDANEDAFDLADADWWIHDDGPDLMFVAVPAGVEVTHVLPGLIPAPTDHKRGKRADLTFTIGATR